MLNWNNKGHTLTENGHFAKELFIHISLPDSTSLKHTRNIQISPKSKHILNDILLIINVYRLDRDKKNTHKQHTDKWVSEWLVFYVAFKILSVISRRWLLVAWDAICARVLSAANTDAPCRRHKTRIHHPVTLPWHWANHVLVLSS